MLSTSLCNIELENPLILASGILDTTGSMMKKIANYAGAITTKSVSLNPREGHKNPTVIETNDYMLNAIGLSNPGIDEFINEIKIVKKTKKPVIGSIIGCNEEEFAKLARKIGNYVDAIEVNISCPNIIGEKIGQEMHRVAVKEYRRYEGPRPVESGKQEGLGESGYLLQQEHGKDDAAQRKSVVFHVYFIFLQNRLKRTGEMTTVAIMAKMMEL